MERIDAEEERRGGRTLTTFTVTNAGALSVNHARLKKKFPNEYARLHQEGVRGSGGLISYVYFPPGMLLFWVE